MRNHGQRMNGGFQGQQRMPGPYARNDGRGPQRMGSMGGGRGGMGMQMPMGMPMGMGMGPGGPGAPLEGAIGPQEAVQGRSLRSYEDLDAAGDKATGELDY